jgi:AraC-like DNA-binding protein
MEQLIQFQPLQLLDLLFRFASVGVLLCLAIMPRQKQYWWSLALIICSIGYLLLTAPIANTHYGWLRPPLLLLTELTTLALFGVYWLHVHGRSPLEKCSIWLKRLLVIWLLWLGYFFLLNGGKGVYHDIHHALSFSLLIYILIDALRGLNDDLVEKRRYWRLAMIAAISLYMAMLTLIELTLIELKDNQLFSIGNVLFTLLLSLSIVRFVFINNRLQLNQDKQKAAPSVDAANANADLNQQQSINVHPLIAKLDNAMKNGAYQQNGLSISQLASDLAVPAHQLRKVINTELGFDNFSQYLNSYRLPAVCRLLEDPARKQDPILTLALEAGYNSIAPFNRAFKQLKGVTPSEYRNQFQK